ncbi:MAG TPA: ABC transporter substrate-binding protein [Streptosporangiaceae bacterium]|nr:ABC transporter substrate-binding protein [Streptosporangiaceae bacterium]
MKPAARTAALLTGAVVVLAAPVVAMRAWSKPADPRIVVGAAAPATLLPGDVRDPTGRMIAGAVWTGLTDYDPRSGTTVNAAAESIDSADRRVWTVRLRAGGRFQDGSPVTAESFTGAWTAVLREGWHGARLFADVARVEGAAEAKKTGRVAGLDVVDDRTFRVTLDRPFGGFPSLLADPAFLPMPAGVLRSRDWRTYERRPIGNGPLRVLRPSPQEITLARAGGRDIVVKTMPDPAEQYAAALAGDIDIATRVPPSRHESMDAEFPRRHLTVPGRSATYLGFPVDDKRYASVALRQALSLAVDRARLTETALGHQAAPADSLIPPGITLGRRGSQCRRCVYDPRAAAAALADSGGLSGPVNLWYAAGDERWVRALAQRLRSDLRLTIEPKPLPAADLADHSPDGPFVVHTTADYPNPVAPLAALLDAPTGYADDYTDDQLDRASRASPEDSVIPARLAESSLLRDLPLIPLWSDHDHLVWSERLRGVTADAFGGLRLDHLSVKA